jgi:glycerate-2-kinase
VVVLASGEVTVTIAGAAGRGGPYQEFALAAALEIAGRAELVVAAVDVDGTDGPTEAAGGVVDGETVGRAWAAGLDPLAALAAHTSYDLLAGTGDLVQTGPTDTNVNDLMLVLAQPAPP